MATREPQSGSYLNEPQGSDINTDEPQRAEQTIPMDPWAHRDLSMRCRTCMFFVVKEKRERTAAITTSPLGRCRRHAPTMSGYPVVFQTDWCGDHKLDENKP